MRIRKRSQPLVSPSPPLTKTHEHETTTTTKTKLHPSSCSSGVVGDLGLEEDTHVDDHLPNQTSRSDLQLTIIRGENGWFCLEAPANEDESEATQEIMKKEKEDQNYSCLCMNRNQTHQQEMEILKMNSKDEVLGGVLEKDEDGANQLEEENKKMRRGCESSRWKRNELDGAETISGVGVPPPSDNNHQVERWCEGDMAFPLKKRRGSFARKVLVGEAEDIVVLDMKEKSKHTHGSVIEGSRCSRVNGRGWRCYQQTLVGYSLCEHHSAQRQRIRTPSTNSRNPDAGKPLRMRTNVNKAHQNGKRIGAVKARSLSTLLGLTCAPHPRT